jgi:ATP-binding cassette subfamily B protein
MSRFSAFNPADRPAGWHALRAQIPYIPRALALVWTAARGLLVAWLALLVLLSMIPVVTVLLTRESVDSVVALVEAGYAPDALSRTITAFALLAGVQVAGDLIGFALGYVRTVQAERVRDHMSRVIQEKATALDLRYFEVQGFYDLLHRVRMDARQRPLSLLENVGTLLRTVLSLLGMVGLLVTYSPLLPLVLLVGGIPALWSIVRYSRRLNTWRLSVSTLERRSSYFDHLLTDQNGAQEVRLFALADHYRRAYAAARSVLLDGRLRLARGKILTDLVVTLFGLVLVGGALVWMGLRVIGGAASLGDLAAFYQIFSRGQGLFGSLMGSAGEIYQNTLFLQDLFTFLGLEPHIPERDAQDGGRVLPLHDAIRIEGVSFAYPGSSRRALEGFSLTIPAGQITALVGENGQGKTTLMKLLCRFYDPDEGRITWDGVDIRELPLGDLRRSITMLFQSPLRYMESAGHNIAVGDLRGGHGQEAIAAAARSSAADTVIDRLPQGYDTMLGKWFGGEELSVGQWQRLALARAFLRDAPLIILDEPTSAMDSWAENDWLARVGEHVVGRTLVMITHRFTTAMLADRIYVMQNSRIVEQGTHGELLALDGVYAASWHEQMRRADQASAV